PLAAEVLARIAKLYAIEADVRGQPADVRRAVRQERSRPLVEDLHLWLQDRLPRLPGWSDLAKAIRYVLRHWDGLILYLDDGRLEMDTNVVERAIRPVCITRKNSLFAGSDAGARRWAIANTLIQTCKLSGVDPLAWLTDVLQRIVSGRTKNQELHTLLAVELAPAIHHRRRVITATTAYLAASSPSQCASPVVPASRLRTTGGSEGIYPRPRPQSPDSPLTIHQLRAKSGRRRRSLRDPIGHDALAQPRRRIGRQSRIVALP